MIHENRALNVLGWVARRVVPDMLSWNLLLQLVDTTCLFPFHSEDRASLIAEVLLVSPCRIASPPPTTNTRCKPTACCILRPQIPGRPPSPDNSKHRGHRSNQPLISRATIGFVAFSLQTWCWAIHQPRLHPAMSSLKLPTAPIHPRHRGMQETRASFPMHHHPETHTQRPPQRWLALYPWLSFLRVHIFPQLLCCDCAFSRLCFGGIKKRKHAGMKTDKQS